MMLETERVMCDLQNVLSTAQSLHMLFLQVMQKARRGSFECVGHIAVKDLEDGIEAAAEPAAGALELHLLEKLLDNDVTGRPCISFHAIICARIDTFGNRILLSMGSLVVGDVE
jgi:hypothetical protein